MDEEDAGQVLSHLAPAPPLVHEWVDAPVIGGASVADLDLHRLERIRYQAVFAVNRSPRPVAASREIDAESTHFVRIFSLPGYRDLGGTACFGHTFTLWLHQLGGAKDFEARLTMYGEAIGLKVGCRSCCDRQLMRAQRLQPQVPSNGGGGHGRCLCARRCRLLASTAVR